MSDPKWSITDELQRLALSYLHKPPTSVIDLFEGFEQAIRAQTPTKSNGFDDLVDDPRAETKESPVVTPSTKIMLYTCPACGVNVFGTAKFATAAGEVPTLNDNGSFTVNMEMVGVRADKHDCSPKVAR